MATCNCLEIGSDGTKEHSGEMVSAMPLGFDCYACENHLGNYEKAHKKWRVAPRWHDQLVGALNGWLKSAESWHELHHDGNIQCDEFCDQIAATRSLLSEIEG